MIEELRNEFKVEYEEFEEVRNAVCKMRLLLPWPNKVG